MLYPGHRPFLSGLAGAIGLTGLTTLQAGAIGAGILLGGGMLASFFHEVFHGISKGISYLMKQEKNTIYEIPEIPDDLKSQDQKEDNLELDNKNKRMLTLISSEFLKSVMSLILYLGAIPRLLLLLPRNKKLIIKVHLLLPRKDLHYEEPQHLHPYHL